MPANTGRRPNSGRRWPGRANPRHPYTKRLIEAVPVPDPAQRRSRFARLDQEIPSATRRIGEAPLKLALSDVGNGHLVAAEG